MTSAAMATGLIGSQPIGNFFVPDTTQRHPLGSIRQYIDPFFGGGEAIYLQMPTSTAINVGTLLAFDTSVSFVASKVANTANLGKSLAIALNYVASNASATYAWCCIAGQCIVWSAGNLAANTAFGIVAAGQAGANSAGKEVLNARSTKASTVNTVVKTNTMTTTGSNTLGVTNSDGLFVGGPISGTGIPASTYIGAIDPSGTLVSMTTSDLSTAANATASGSITLTQAFNDGSDFYNVITCSRPFAQGAIT